VAAEWGSVEVELGNDDGVGVFFVVVLERDVESICSRGFGEIVGADMGVSGVICGKGSAGGLDGGILFICTYDGRCCRGN